MFGSVIVAHKYGNALPINSEFDTNIIHIIGLVAPWRDLIKCGRLYHAFTINLKLYKHFYFHYSKPLIKRAVNRIVHFNFYFLCYRYLNNVLYNRFGFHSNSNVCICHF